MHKVTFYGQLDHIEPISLQGNSIEVVISGLKQYVPNIRYLLSKHNCSAHIEGDLFTPNCEISIVPEASGSAIAWVAIGKAIWSALPNNLSGHP